MFHRGTEEAFRLWPQPTLITLKIQPDVDHFDFSKGHKDRRKDACLFYRFSTMKGMKGGHGFVWGLVFVERHLHLES
jgi:hypothetical protein